MIAPASDLAPSTTVGVMYQTDAQFPIGRDFTETGRTYAMADEDTDWYEEARILRSDPTVALARAILAAPILNNDWAIRGQDEQAVELVKKVLLPHKKRLLREAINSAIDYGWQSWETRPMRVEGEKTIFFKTKALRHEFTTILTDKSGFPNGVKNTSYFSLDSGGSGSRPTGERRVNSPYVSFAAGGEEYGNPQGYALLKNVSKVMERYNEAEDAASRYMQRVAGAHWVLWYPEGLTVKMEDKDVPTDVVALRILDSLRASGRVALPVSQAELANLLSSMGQNKDAKRSGWDLKMIESSGGMDPFLERQRYLDALKMRALLIPERTSLEGQFGTKAESSEHADVAMLAIAQWGNAVLDWFNQPWGFIGNILAFNKIPWYPGRVEIQPLPLVDEEKMFFKELFRTIVNGVEGWARVVDVTEIAARTNVPIDKEMVEKLKKMPLPDPSQQSQGNGNTDPKIKNDGGTSQKSGSGEK